jgi:peptidoglycan/LPS O-acetylase OafA/YrhL
MPITRFWEFLIGALIARTVRDTDALAIPKQVLTSLSWAALLCLITLPFFQIKTYLIQDFLDLELLLQ